MRKLLSKRVFLLSLLLMSLALIPGMELIAQDTVATSGSFTDLVNQLIGDWFKTAAAFSAIVLTASGLINSYLLPDVTGLIKQLISWGIAILLSIIGYSLDMGIFSELTVAGSIVLAVQIASGSNSIFDLLKGILKARKSE